MALTPEDKQKILGMLDKMSEEKVQKVLATEFSFSLWLKNVLYEIYLKIVNFIQDMWNFVRDIF